ncbi:MAG TPA: DUF6687 family protein [Kofleriaceae bacterium]|nr:DUF6687 family protein [Kofleriaceae bacterium]
MRFDFYSERLAGADPISVDGIVPGDGLHLTHWQGNRTPAELKADTSTGIALRFVTSPDRAEMARGAEVASNNHYDADGVLSVWTVLSGERAAAQADLLVAAAEAGDFSAHPGREGLKVALALQSEDGVSPLASQVRGAPVDDDEEAYRLVLPVVGELVAAPDRFEPLWRDGLAAIDRAMDGFAAGRSRVDEDPAHLVSAVQLERGVPLEAARHAISHHASGRLYLIASELAGGGWSYRIDWPYWSWAETVDRPRIERVDLEPLAARLRALDPGGTWRLQRGHISDSLEAAGSRARPEEVAAEVRAALG